ncbi:hypothetical protein FQA39_LY03164 [Lamprigera yunnana]|nr:hypothetical protein FQA39_LY03164 [Lamprigera yunnana]
MSVIMLEIGLDARLLVNTHHYELTAALLRFQPNVTTKPESPGNNNPSESNERRKSNAVNQEQDGSAGGIIDNGLTPIQLEMLAQRLSEYNQIPQIPAAWERLARNPEMLEGIVKGQQFSVEKISNQITESRQSEQSTAPKTCANSGIQVKRMRQTKSNAVIIETLNTTISNPALQAKGLLAEKLAAVGPTIMIYGIKTVDQITKATIKQNLEDIKLKFKTGPRDKLCSGSKPFYLAVTSQKAEGLHRVGELQLE